MPLPRGHEGEPQGSGEVNRGLFTYLEKKYPSTEAPFGDMKYILCNIYIYIYMYICMKY